MVVSVRLGVRLHVLASACVAAVDGVVHAKSKRGGERCAAPPAPAVVFDATGAFALGSAGGTSCKFGKANVLTPADCQRAAAAAARPYGGSVRFDGLPAGCFWFRVGAGSFFFNKAVGQRNVHAQPVCAGAPDSKHEQCPSSANICIRARLCVCVCARARACAPVCALPPACPRNVSLHLRCRA